MRRPDRWVRWVNAATLGATVVLAVVLMQRLIPQARGSFIGARIAGVGSLDTERDLRERGVRLPSGHVLTRMDVLELSRSGLRIGPDSALLVVLVWGDYACSWCRELDTGLERLRARFPDHFAVVHLPLIGAQPAGLGLVDLHAGAYCARDQGRFEAFHRSAFRQAPHAARRNGWRGVATDARIPDLDRFERCVLGDEYRDSVRVISELGARWGLRATPTLLVGGRVIVGAPTSAVLDSAVAAELAGLRDPYH